MRTILFVSISVCLLALLSCQKEDPPEHTPSPVVNDYSMSWDIHGGSGQVQSFIYVNSQEVTSEPVSVHTGDSITATIKKVGMAGQMGQAGITIYLDGLQKLQDIRTIENGTEFSILLIPE